MGAPRFDGLKKIAGEAVTKASEGLQAAESVAGRAGMTKKNGEISKFKVARKVLLKPLKPHAMS